MKKYTTTIWPFASLVVIGLITFGVAGFMGAENWKRAIIGTGMFASVPLMAIVLFGWFTYEKIEANHLHHVVLVQVFGVLLKLR